MIKETFRRVLPYVVSTCAAMILIACGGGEAQSTPAAQNSNSNGSGPGGGSSSGPTGSYTVAGNIGSVLGIDSAGRGYRDDVAQLISDSYSSNPVVKSAAEGAAKAYQQSLGIDLNSVTNTQQYLVADANRGACAVHKAGVQYGAEVIQAMKAVYARTFNTPDRIAQRQAFVNKAPQSFSVDLPDASNC